MYELQNLEREYEYSRDLARSKTKQNNPTQQITAEIPFATQHKSMTSLLRLTDKIELSKS